MTVTCGNSGDFSLYRGDTTPVAWQFLNADGSFFDITGYDFSLLIVFQSGQQTYVTPAAPELAINTGTSTLTWTPTAADTNALPLGPSSQYQLTALISATVTTWVTGTITGLGNG